MLIRVGLIKEQVEANKNKWSQQIAPELDKNKLLPKALKIDEDSLLEAPFSFKEKMLRSEVNFANKLPFSVLRHRMFGLYQYVRENNKLNRTLQFRNLIECKYLDLSKL